MESGRRRSEGGGGRAGSASGSKRPRSVVEEDDGDDSGEGLCFVCKDGGDLRLCDFRGCHKAYHPGCVGKGSDFLTSDEDFICEWHTCFICKGRSSYFCFCCPKHSFCKHCVKQAKFVRVLGKTKGFCNNCLRTAIMIERNVDVNSDGERADFSDRTTFEFLFKDYWEITKDNEGLTLDKLEEAYAFLKRGKYGKLTDVADLEKVTDKDCSSDDDFVVANEDKTSSPWDLNGVPRKIKCFSKEVKSNENGYMGWGSGRLLKFLSSIGKDTSNSLDQFGASQVVKEYIRQNDLLQKDKKKLVICDDKLKSLFRKSKLRYNRIFSLLKRHITENMTSEDEAIPSCEAHSASVMANIPSCEAQTASVMANIPSYEAQSASIMAKKVRTMCYESRTPKCGSEIDKTRFASLTHDNIKLIYLKKSLVVDLLTEPDTFEMKVVGCFVRVKSDPKDYNCIKHKKMYQLEQVIGTKKSSKEYQIRDDVSTDVLLCVSNISDIRISMLLDGDLKQEDCEDLRLMAQKGTIKRLTVGDLEDKARSLHGDVVSHWINREIRRLERLYDLANVNGWKEEKRELMEKLDLLRKPSEVQRLLEELPQVIPEIEDNCDSEFQATAQNTLTFQATASDADCSTVITHVQKQGTEDAEASDSCDIPFDRKKDTEGTEANTAGDTPGTADQKQGPAAGDGATTIQDIIIIEDDEKDHLGERGGQTAVIDLEAVDATDAHPLHHVTDDFSYVWYYTDPQGDVQGPVTIERLRRWWDDGYFPEDFKVWRMGQTRDSAVLLRGVLRVNALAVAYKKDHRR